MRSLFITSISLLVLLCCSVSCSNQDNTAQQEALRMERDSLMIVNQYSQRELSRMTAFFDEVAACIDSITEQETLLAAQIDVETNRRYSQREMSRRLNQLSEIIMGQRERISSLVDSLNNRVDTTRTNGLRSTIKYLIGQLAEKEEQINRLKAEIGVHQRNIRSLNDRVDNLTAEVSDLTVQNNALTEAVQVQTEIINEGSVLVATKEQLKAMGVIEGGGLLKRSKTNLSKVNLSMCSRVNIAEFSELPIRSKKVTILSPAPSSSYALSVSGDVTTLIIRDANAFWSLSNILVIQTQ
ncbi:MAG: hypothetical protein K2N28_10675 [Muribaculaceae bacterium]|nr:hypothetical protein [Muribaculaceae bacterium]